jgi:hypothetical protein
MHMWAPAALKRCLKIASHSCTRLNTRSHVPSWSPNPCCLCNATTMPQQQNLCERTKAGRMARLEWYGRARRGHHGNNQSLHQKLTRKLLPAVRNRRMHGVAELAFDGCTCEPHSMLTHTSSVYHIMPPRIWRGVPQTSKQSLKRDLPRCLAPHTTQKKPQPQKTPHNPQIQTRLLCWGRHSSQRPNSREAYRVAGGAVTTTGDTFKSTPVADFPPEFVYVHIA